MSGQHLVAVNQHMLANAGGTTSRLKGRFDSGRSRLAQADRIVVYLDRTQARMSRQHLVASTRMTPANAGETTGQSACPQSRRSVVQFHPRATG